MKAWLWIVAGVVLLSSAALLWIARAKKRPRDPEHRIVEKSKSPESPDKLVLDQLRAAGSDLSQPHDPEFFLYFPDRDHAESALVEVNMTGGDPPLFCGRSSRLSITGRAASF
jgi:regulator of ribonuclease activity B